MPTSRLLNPTLDLNFKRVFAKSPDLLIDLINAVRWQSAPIVELEILNPEIVPEDVDKKLIILDILARDDAGQMLNIEMQSRRHMAVPSRMLFYLARILSHQLHAGEDYQHVKPVIGVTLMDFDLFDVPEQAVWTFELRDAQYPDIALDNSLSLHMVEFPKAERLAHTAPSKIPPALAEWITYFRHWKEDNVMQQIQHPAVRKAHKRLHAVSKEDKAWVQALERERNLMMEASFRAQTEEEKAATLAQGLAQGIEQGIEQGIKQGIKRGMMQGQSTLLRRLLRAKFAEIPETVDQRLLKATSEQLELWSERILSAQTLEQVFSQH